MGKPERPKCYVTTVQCKECQGPIKYCFTSPPEHRKAISLEEEIFITEKTIVNQSLLDEEYNAWFNDIPSEDIITEHRYDEPKKKVPHHLRHHPKITITQQKTEDVKKPKYTDKICCSECDYPYHMYKRRHPPHLYSPTMTKLPILYKETPTADKTKDEIGTNATDIEKLTWAISNQQYDEIKRLSTDLFANMVENLNTETVLK